MKTYEIVFESDRIYFCNVDYMFIEDYMKMINNPNISKMISHQEMHMTYNDEFNWVTSQIDAIDEVTFTMIDKETKEFIGNISLMHIKDNSAEMGICITANMQDKHYGTEAIKALVEYGYTKLGLTNIYLNVFNFNKRAIKCYENVGFIQDGVGILEDDIHMTHKKC